MKFYAAQQRQRCWFLSRIVLVGWNWSYFTTSSLNGLKVFWKRGMHPLDMVPVPSCFFPYTEWIHRVPHWESQRLNLSDPGCGWNEEKGFFYFFFIKQQKTMHTFGCGFSLWKTPLHSCHMHFRPKYSSNPRAPLAGGGVMFVCYRTLQTCSSHCSARYHRKPPQVRWNSKTLMVSCYHGSTNGTFTL